MLTVRRTPRARVRVPATLGSLESVAALALAHLAAGGTAPAPWWLAVFGVLVYAASGFVLRRRAGIRTVLPVLVAAQVLGHAWLVALSPAAHGGHAHGEGIVLGLTPSMLVAHAVAAAVTGTMWALRRRAVDVLLGWSDPGALPLPQPRTTRVHGRNSRPALLLHVVTAPTRGPPVRAFAIA
ncbi:hypothetical protein ASE01_10200 [Nocardioides sp. Root190]|uniref:hypothetical protein n=1 Tax=Nocardioides sp. Root190 TaxID=1736488 RepID=UPI0006F9C2D2|nr:hypothetical protein [Nocardioides sp. Root190]KRB77113.1 hypothetical protein ASE01_10200 [Nocardioides sp. Root190]